MDKQNAKIIYFLIAIMLMLFVISILLTDVIDDFSSNPFLFLMSVHPLVFFAIILSIIIILYLIRVNNSLNYAYLIVAILVPFCIDFTYRLVVTFPLSQEMYHSAGIFYILEHGTANFPSTLKPETICPQMLGAIFSLMTGIDPLTVASYMPTLFYPGLFSLFAYILARKLNIEKPFAMLGALYSVGLYFAILGMDRATYCLPLYLLATIPILYKMNSYSSRSYIVIFLLSLFALVFSDMQFLMLMPSILLIPVVLIILVKMKISTNKITLQIKPYLILSLLVFITFISWNIYAAPTHTAEAFNIPIEIYNGFIASLSEGASQPSFVGGYNPYLSPFIRSIGYSTGGALLLILILILFLFVKQRNSRGGFFSFDIKNLSFILAFFIPTSLLALFNYKRTSLIWISILTVFMLNLLWQKRNSCKITKLMSRIALFFIMFVLIISPFVTWTASQTYISVQETYQMSFISQNLPQTIPELNSVLILHVRGSFSTGISDIFGNRTDVAVSDFFTTPDKVLYQQSTLEGNASLYFLTMVGSIMRLGAIYDVNMETYILKLLNMADLGQLNIIYDSGDNYYIFNKRIK